MLTRLLSVLAVSVLLVAPGCDKKGKEGSSCKTPTLDSSDCDEGLKCAMCDRGPECVRVRGASDANRLRVDGRVCEQIRNMATTSDVNRGEVPGSNL